MQHVPASVAGSLTRFAAQSLPYRLWPNEQEPQNEASSGGGPAAIESCFQVLARKVPSECSGFQSAKPGFFLLAVFTGTAGVVERRTALGS